MTGPYRGGCLCGAIGFEVDEFGPRIAHCHCSMCRKFHGAGFATIAGVRRAQFRWITGRDALATYTAGNGTTRSFCRHCGSSLLFSSPRASPEVLEVALGAFDGDLPVIPDAHIYTDNAANWVRIDDDLPRYAAGRDGAVRS